MLAILDKYYVYTEDSLKVKAKTSINPTVNQQIGEDILGHYDVISKLDSIKDIPIVVTQGCDDILTPKLIKELLIDYIPHSKLITIRNCGHWTVVEKPDEMNEIAHDFFNSTF